MTLDILICSIVPPKISPMVTCESFTGCPCAGTNEPSTENTSNSRVGRVVKLELKRKVAKSTPTLSLFGMAVQFGGLAVSPSHTVS